MRAAQDDAMVFTSALDALSTEGHVKIYSQTKGFQVQGTDSGVILLKVILVESGM